MPYNGPMGIFEDYMGGIMENMITFEVEGASLDQRSYVMGLIGINLVEWQTVESATIKDLFVLKFTGDITEDQIYVLTDVLDMWHLRYRRIEANEVSDI